MRGLCSRTALVYGAFVDPSKTYKKNDFYIKLIKNIKIEILKKSGLGWFLVQFGVRIRILREKLYILLGSDPFFIDFRKIDFFENSVFRYFSTF